MRLSFEQFKQKIAETKAKIAATFSAANPNTPKPGKASSTQKKRWRRARKTAARAACGSYRYWQKHAGGIRRAARREQDQRRYTRLTPISSSLRKSSV